MRLLSPSLQAFLAVAEHKTVHAAAAVLHLTQTAVTQRIKSLEIHLSTGLFVRSRRGMQLTTEGEALLHYCREFQTLENKALSCITNTGTEKNVLLCMTGPTTIMHSRIIPSCITVMKKFPRLLMRFDINDSENTAQSLRHGESQLAIIDQYLLSEEMTSKKLKPQEYILVASNKWKKRRLKEIIKNERIIDFDLHDQMTFHYLKKYDLFDLANKDRYFVNRTEILATMMVNELGYGVLPAEFAQSYLAKKQLIILNAGKTYPHQLVLAWFPLHQPPPYFSALLEACV
ncbi:MAG: LysR family transcriptional regulator [uncultured bacterium]|nr:MAG: LysR family transcriptional regulator [uncultured bacterium]